MRAYVAPGFFMTRIANPIIARLGLAPTLTVRGRRTGVPRTVPFGGPFEYGGARYLVSGRGETDWARNLRAAGRGEMKLRGRVESVAAMEITGPERDRVLDAYRSRFGGSVTTYFQRIPEAADHPVFRIETVTEGVAMTMANTPGERSSSRAGPPHESATSIRWEGGPMFQLFSLMRRHPLTSYFAVTLLVSYLISVPLVLSAQGLITAEVPGWLHYLYSFGPITGAFAVTAIVGGRAAIAELVGRMARWRMGRGWTVVAIGSPFGLFAIAAVVMRVIDGVWPDLTRLGEVNYLGNIGLAVVPLWIVTYGYGEETGWRGFALPRLQARYSALAAALIVAVAWMIWHLPAFLYLPTYRNLDPVIVPFFFVGVLLGSILLTWLYNGTGGSIFAVAMWHALWDLVSASKGSEGTLVAVMTTVIALWAIGIVVIARPGTLSPRPKQVLAAT